MSKQFITFLELHDFVQCDIYKIHSLNDAKQITKNISFQGNRNFLDICFYKDVYLLDTDDVIQDIDHFQSVERGNYLKPRPGEVHYCWDKTHRATNIEDYKYIHIYNMSGTYYKVIKKHHESFRCFVMDKLEYEEGIKKRFPKKYVYNWQTDYVLKKYFPEKFPNLPCLCEDTRENHIILTNLKDEDIVVNRNLQQLWPKTTGKTPNVLVELLNKTTDKIR